MSVFQRPPRGVGADTGIASFKVPLLPGGMGPGDGEPIAHSLCQYESREARRLGPLLLSVMVSNRLLQQSDVVQGSLQSQPMVSRSMGVDAFVAAADVVLWGNDSMAPVVGSLVIDYQVGSVRRTVVADLVSGTYQLPPCDVVMVSAVMRSLAGDYVVPEMFVQASVTPGFVARPRDLVFSDMAGFGDTEFGNDVTRQFLAPEGATAARAVMLTRWATVSNGAHAVRLAAQSYVSGYVQLSAEWADSSCVGALTSRFVVPAGVRPWLGLQWRIDL